MKKVTQNDVAKFCKWLDESIREADERLESATSIDRLAYQMRCIALCKVQLRTYILLREKEHKNGKSPD